MEAKLPTTKCEIPMPKVKPCALKCEKCNGKGIIQIAPNIRGIQKCPHCGGWGKLRQ